MEVERRKNDEFVDESDDESEDEYHEDDLPGVNFISILRTTFNSKLLCKAFL